MSAFGSSELYYLAEILEHLEATKTLSDFQNSLAILDNIAQIDACIFTGIEFEHGEIVTNSALNRFPEEWVQRYLSVGYNEVDPVALSAINDPGIPQKWSETYRKNPPPQKFLFESSDFNLTDGVCMGWKTGNFLSQLSIASSVTAMADVKRLKGILSILVPYFHAAMYRVTCASLTKRETETLKLIAEGFTNQEVAEKLIPSVSYDAVLQTSKRIKAKLKARNIQHAIFIATKLALI